MNPLLCLLVLLISGAPALAQQGSAVNAPRPTAITGRVLNEEGQPLRGAMVTVFRLGGSPPTGAVTDAEGKFRITNLTPGNYRVAAALTPLVSATNAGPTFVGDDVTLTLVKGGVITGTVSDTNNEPLVGAMVSAQRVRDAEGEPASGGGFGSAMSDDRGIYRLFGLPAGAYLVVARNNAGLAANAATDAPTYFPSASRAAAQEVSVGVGAVTSDINIRFRGASGYTVSGTVSGLVDPNVDTNISLSLTVGGELVASGFLYPRAMGNRFTLYGVPDGEYELRATRQGFHLNEPRISFTPLPVRVRGGDVAGLDLKLLPAALLTGRVVVEQAPSTNRSCVSNRVGRVEEMRISATSFDFAQRRSLIGGQAVPEATGDFFLRNLSAGRFRLMTDLPSDSWYVKSLLLRSPRLNLPSARAQSGAPRVLDVGQHGVTLAVGEQLSGLTLTIAEGAASVRGRVVTAPGALLPPHLLVHLVPVEATAHELRFAVAQVRRDATFSLQHLAPGRYWIVARLAMPSELAPESPAELRRAASAAHQAMELTSCQHVQNFVLKFEAGVK